MKKAAEGWQVGGVARIQSGTPTIILSGRQTCNNNDPGGRLIEFQLRLNF